MDTNEIVAQMEAEREAIDKAIAALTGSRSTRGRGKRRHMSAEARERISKAQKARWRKQKKEKE